MGEPRNAAGDEAFRTYPSRSSDAKGRHWHQDYTDCPKCDGPALKDTIAVYGMCSKCRGPMDRPPQPSSRLRRDILTRQFAWLKLLRRTFPAQHIVIQHMRRGKRHVWGSKPCCSNHRVYHRVILPFEVVFDIDKQPWERIVVGLAGALDRLGIPHILAWSGGKGPHVHVFLSSSGRHLGVDSWKWIRRAFARMVLVEAGLEDNDIDWRPVSNRNYAIRDLGVFRTNGRVKTAVENVKNLKAVASSAKADLRLPNEIRTYSYFLSRQEREDEIQRYQSRVSKNNIESTSFEQIHAASPTPRNPTPPVRAARSSPASDPISMVLSNKESIDFDKLLAGTHEAVERCGPRLQSDDVPYSHMFREGKADKWLATVIAPEVNHLARGNLAGYLFKEVGVSSPQGTPLDWFDETVRVLGVWHELANQVPWAGEDPYTAPNLLFKSMLGWTDYNEKITRGQAFSWLKSKGLIRHSLDTPKDHGTGVSSAGSGGRSDSREQ